MILILEFMECYVYLGKTENSINSKCYVYLGAFISQEIQKTIEARMLARMLKNENKKSKT
jgi:hypothetical protein